MTGIVIQYRPIGFLPFTRRRTFNLPAKWNELNGRQMESIYLAWDPRADENKLVRLFLGVSDLFVRKLDSYQKYSILRQLRYLNNIDFCDKFIIKKIGKFYAPDRYLKNVTFGQFIFGDTYFDSYSGGKREDLDRFIACYYTRGLFSEKDIEHNAMLIAREGIRKREAIALNYRLIREWLAKRYPNVFEKKNLQKKKDRSNGWVGVFDKIVGDNITDTDKYANAPLSHILRYIEAKIVEYQKQKRHGR